MIKDLIVPEYNTPWDRDQILKAHPGSEKVIALTTNLIVDIIIEMVEEQADAQDTKQAAAILRSLL